MSICLLCYYTACWFFYTWEKLSMMRRWLQSSHKPPPLLFSSELTFSSSFSQQFPTPRGASTMLHCCCHCPQHARAEVQEDLIQEKCRRSFPMHPSTQKVHSATTHTKPLCPCVWWPPFKGLSTRKRNIWAVTKVREWRTRSLSKWNLGDLYRSMLYRSTAYAEISKDFQSDM